MEDVTSSAGTQLKLASSYLDDLEKAVDAFPKEFFSYERLSGQFLGRKETLIRKLLDTESASAFAAIDRAAEVGADERELSPLTGRAHRLTGVLWSAMSCSWLGFPHFGRTGSTDEKERDDALNNAADHLRKAVEREEGTHQIYSLYRLGEILRNGERFQEANQAFQRIIDDWPDSNMAIEAMKAQEQLQKATQQTESRKSPPAETKSGPCFVATAVYGSPLASQIGLLREFRDTVLRNSRMGNGFVALYDRCGPPLAKWIADRPIARTLVRILILTPMLAVARRMLRKAAEKGVK